jgi:hypothetical protein
MFHKNVSNSIRSLASITSSSPLGPQPASRSFLPASRQPDASLDSQAGSPPAASTAPRLILLPAGGSSEPRPTSSALLDLVSICAHRCSSFFAEAAVLVLVLALLDRFMLKGRMEINWVLSAFTISLLLLATSIATEFTARRWLKAH